MLMKIMQTMNKIAFLSEKIPEKLRVAWSNFNLSLMPGDSIIVKEKPGAIYVLGNVYVLV